MHPIEASEMEREERARDKAEIEQLRIEVATLRKSIKQNHLEEKEFFEACGVPPCETHNDRCPAHAYHWIITAIGHHKTSLKNSV